MRKLILGAFVLTILIISSCGDDELAPTPSNENSQDTISESIIPDSAVVLNTIPSYVAKALSNARRLFDKLGETKEIKSDKTFFYATDNNGNTFVIDTLGNADIYFNTKETIHIDNSVRESDVTTDSTVCNTTWTGWGNTWDSSRNSNSSDIFEEDMPTYGIEIFLFSYYDYINSIGAVYDETTIYKDERSVTEHEPGSYKEINFKNSVCIITSWDTVRVCKITNTDRYKKIKVKEQVIKNERGIYKIEIKDCVANFYEYSTKKNAFWLAHSKKLANDSTFEHFEETETLSKELLDTKVYKYYNAYNYKRDKQNIIYIYNNVETYYNFSHGNIIGFTFPIYNDYNYVDIHFQKH